MKKKLDVLMIIFLYCFLNALLRIYISPTMSLDESEQFINGSYFSFGYPNQPPLYSWIVFTISQLIGLNIRTIIFVKYLIIFIFYFSFFLFANSVWNKKTSFIIVGSLLFFPTYSYEFIRDLSHSILVSAIAVIACFYFIKISRHSRSIDYLFFGIILALGFLSKYNFGLFLIVFILSALSVKDYRMVLLNKNIIITFIAFFIILFPHCLWLVENNLLPFKHALKEASAGHLSKDFKILSIFASIYWEILIILLLFLFLFGFKPFYNFKMTKDISPEYRFFRYFAIYTLIVPLIVVFVFQVGQFTGRWMAPLFFVIPLALFSLVNIKEEYLKKIGYLSLLIIFAVFGIRSILGFGPDITGKTERIHVRFDDLSFKIGESLKEKGIYHRSLIFLSDREFLAANVATHFKGAKAELINSKNFKIKNEGVAKILLWDVKKHGRTVPEKFIYLYPSAYLIGIFEVPFYYSSRFKPNEVGVAFVHKF